MKRKVTETQYYQFLVCLKPQKAAFPIKDLLQSEPSFENGLNFCVHSL